MEAADTTPPVRAERGWPRAAVLFGMSLSFTGFLAVAYLTMLVALPVKRRGAWVTGGFMALVAAMGERTTLWWVERGWGVLVGGCFVALTLAQADAGFLTRGLGALAGGLAVGAALLVLRGDLAKSLELQVADKVHAAVAAWEPSLREMVADPTSLTPAFFASVEKGQMLVFPAIVGLTTICALGVAWWFYVRMGHGSDQGLLPLREFRFNDHLVWLLIGGVVLLMVGLQREGTNAVLFMAALYAVRGAAVAAFFGAGSTLTSAFFLMLGLFFAFPAILVGALVIGLGDTWLDLRGKVRAMTGVS